MDKESESWFPQLNDALVKEAYNKPGNLYMDVTYLNYFIISYVFLSIWKYMGSNQ